MDLNEMLFDLKCCAESSRNFENDNWGCCSREDCMQAYYEYRVFKLLYECLEKLIKIGVNSSEVINKELCNCLSISKRKFF